MKKYNSNNIEEVFTKVVKWVSLEIL
jgi:hypothetical protein